MAYFRSLVTSEVSVLYYCNALYYKGRCKNTTGANITYEDILNFYVSFTKVDTVLREHLRWPTDLADRVRSSLEVKSSQP